MKKIIILLLSIYSINCFCQLPTLDNGKKFTIKVKGLALTSTGGASNIDSLDNLLDVTVTTPTNNQILIYKSGQWVNGNVSGSGTVTSVGLIQPTQGITVSSSTTNPITSAGNYTLSLANDLLGLENISTTGIAVRTAPDTWTTRSLTAGANVTITNPDGVAGNPIINASFSQVFQSYAHSGTTSYTNTLSNGGGAFTLQAGANITLSHNGAGVVTIIGAGGGGGGGSVTSVGLNQPSEGITVTSSTTNPITSSGTFSLSLANDLAALESMVSTGIAVRTGTSTWANRIISGSSGITVTNGDGVAGNIVISASGGSGLTGSGTSNFVGKFSSLTSMVNSTIQDNGTNISMNGAALTSGILTQWPAGEIRVGTADGTQRIAFGDYYGAIGSSNPRVSVGEENVDRLVLRGGTMGILLGSGANPGTSGQVLTSDGSNVFWSTPSSGGGTLSFSSITGSTATLTNGTSSVTINAGTNVTFGGISSLTINSTASGGGGGTVTGMSTSGSLITSLIGGSGTVQYVAGSGMTITNSGTSNNAVLNFTSTGGTTYTAGSGISIVGNVISNTGDNDNNSSNEFQTLTLTGQSLAITPSGNTVTLPVVGISAGSGISVTSVSGTYTITNSSPGITYTGGTGISVSGSVITNTLPGVTYTAGAGISISAGVISNTSLNTDGQNLSLTGQALAISGGTGVTLPVIGISPGSGITITSTAGNYTVTNTGVTSVSVVGGTGITVTGSPITSTGTITLSVADQSNSNEAQTLSGSGNAIVLGQTATGFGGGTITVTSSGLASATVSGNILNVSASYSDPDASATNEIQSLTLSGQSLGISLGGSGVTLPVVGVQPGSGIQVSSTSGVFTITNLSPGITYTGGTDITVSGSTISKKYNPIIYNVVGTYTIPAGVTDAIVATGSTSVTFLNLPSTVVNGQDLYITIDSSSAGRTIYNSDPAGVSFVTFHVRGVNGSWKLVSTTN